VHVVRLSSQMLNDEFAFSVIREVVVPEDGAIVELRQTVNTDLMCLRATQNISNVINTICTKRKYIRTSCQPISELRSVACHMGSPRLNDSEAGKYSI